MKILLLGSGGREHCFAYMLAKSPLCEQLFIAPGNPGTEKHGENIPISTTDFDAIAAFVLNNEIAMVVVGPEEPLVKGIYDFFSQTPALKEVAVIGPSKGGAMLEGSKDFAKQFMRRHHIPTAKHASFTTDTVNEGLKYIDSNEGRIVLKADGLAAGKGVVISDNKEEAKIELQEMLSGKFGAAGNKVVVEEFLQGIEMSCFILTDGTSYLILPTAKDYKRVGESDTGLNTGGMGAVSPVPFARKELMSKIDAQIIRPTINGLKKEGIVYKGFIYFGLMIKYEGADIEKGNPFMIEYNCRMGDPETQAVLPLIRNDLLELLVAVNDDELHTKVIDVLPYTAVTVVLTSGGYPGDYETGKQISNLEQTSQGLIFQAGTRKRWNGDIETSGGRVIAVTSFAADIMHARDLALNNAVVIDFAGKYYRRDIGNDLLR